MAVSHFELAADLLLVKENIHQVSVAGPLSNSEKSGKNACLPQGKMLRPTVLLYTGLALGADREKLVDGATAVELLHRASLIHDDVIDHAGVRRGEITAQGIFGNKIAVLWGDFYFANALRYAGKLGDEAVVEAAEAVERMVKGEIRQLTSMGNLTINVKETLEQGKAKTGALFALAAKLGAIVAKAPYTIRALAGEFGERLGVVFQMNDDYLDYFGEPGSLGKAVGRDMCDGVVTLPLLLASHLAPQTEFMRLFVERSLTVESLPEVRRWIVESGAEQRMLYMMRQQQDLALAALRCLPQNIYRDALANCVEAVASASPRA